MSANPGKWSDQWSVEQRQLARETRARVRKLHAEYRLLCDAQAPIERIFWQLEQRKGKLADQLANEGVAPFCRPRRGGQGPRKRLTRKGGSPCP
jgi:hypothetical protein